MSSTRERGKARWLLMESVRGRRRDVLRLAGWSTLEAVPAFLSGRLVAEAIDRGFLAGRVDTGLAWLAALALAVLVGAWATRQSFLRMSSLVEPFRDALVRRAVTSAITSSAAAGASRDPGAVARLTQHVEIVREAYASVLMAVQGFLVVTVSALLGLLALAPVVLIIVVPPLALSLALFFTALPRMAARQRESILAEERLARDGGAVAAGLRDLVACGAELHASRRIGRHAQAHATAMRALARLTAVRSLAVALGGLVPIVLILAAGPWLVARGATTGTIFGAIAYVAGGVHPALQALMRGVGGPGLWLLVTLRRIAQATSGDAAPALAPASAPGRPRVAAPVGSGSTLRLENVTFAYGPYAQPVVQDLDLTIPAGQHLAVVGPSGVGKSTLGGLLTGVLRPQAGEARMGGVPLGEIDAADLARRRTLIPQEAYVFAGTLRENLGYLRPWATDAEIDAVLETLAMRDLAGRLGGLDAQLDAGVLSAGERQLITLARAHLSPAEVVVLDEATCHLDPAMEARVERALAERPGTLIVIAHRISSALRADRVLVMDSTRVLLGTHRELLAQSALYRDLIGRWEPGAEDGPGVGGLAG